jgi:hypothetical protein
MNPYPRATRALFVTTLFSIFLTLAIACTKTQGDLAWTVLKDTTGAVCPLVVQSVQPGLAPLCVGLSELETVVQALTSAQKPDAGAAQPGLAAAAFTEDELYQAILARRAQGAQAKP